MEVCRIVFLLFTIKVLVYSFQIVRRVSSSEFLHFYFSKNRSLCKKWSKKTYKIMTFIRLCSSGCIKREKQKRTKWVRIFVEENNTRIVQNFATTMAEAERESQIISGNLRNILRHTEQQSPMKKNYYKQSGFFFYLSGLFLHLRGLTRPDLT